MIIINRIHGALSQNHHDTCLISNDYNLVALIEKSCIDSSLPETLVRRIVKKIVFFCEQILLNPNVICFPVVLTSLSSAPFLTYAFLLHLF